MTQDGLRPIDIGDRPHVVGEHDEIPALARVPIADLGLDDRYQRPLAAKNWKAITKIAQNFDWKRFSPILVAPAGNGKFAIIDGQHRTHAALMRGYTHVPAMVVAMTIEQQASAFAAVNGDVTAITTFHLYKAALVAQENWAVRSTAVVRDAGCHLMTYPVGTNQRRPGQITSIGLIRDHVDAGRGEMVTAALRGLVQSPSGDWPDLYGHSILKQWMAALAALQDWRKLDIAGFLEQVDLLAMYDNVGEQRKGNAKLMREPPSAIFRRMLLMSMQNFIATGSVRPSEAA